MVVGAACAPGGRRVQEEPGPNVGSGASRVLHPSERWVLLGLRANVPHRGGHEEPARSHAVAGCLLAGPGHQHGDGGPLRAPPPTQPERFRALADPVHNCDRPCVVGVPVSLR
eukprot:10454247-Alexandrium_andersonii.AAC.1